jgi:hypothetical protein|tara:strand:+ start:542 stop:1801 length:1260 start_codon:yes stop_codon:yes gene_type:complete
MSLPTLTPTSQTSAIILPITGTAANVAEACPIGAYTGSVEFLAGAAAQVAYTYKKLGGDILDIELKEENVYANYEEAVLEYSYIVNIHQSKNIVGSALGGATGSFNHQGLIDVGHSLSGSNIELRYPRFSFETSFRIGEGFATEAGIGGTRTIYSASLDTVNGQQDYDLQAIVETAADDSNNPFYNKVGEKRIKIRDVFYVTPRQMWRFFGYYGGLNVVGDAHTYGQYADDSTFQVIPAWQNKIQAISYEDHLYTRTSHYSYEIIDNNLRIYPIPDNVSPDKFWFRFTVDDEQVWEDDKESGQHGINNMNTLPFENIPYENINSIGKQWIRRFALALSKETLGQVRGKFGGNIPIPGENVTLNASDLLGQAKEEQDKLREELKTQLDEMTYPKLIASDKEMAEGAKTIMNDVPNGIFVG